MSQEYCSHSYDIIGANHCPYNDRGDDVIFQCKSCLRVMCPLAEGNLHCELEDLYNQFEGRCEKCEVRLWPR